jgi:hypothetical protein
VKIADITGYDIDITNVRWMELVSANVRFRILLLTMLNRRIVTAN